MLALVCLGCISPGGVDAWYLVQFKYQSAANYRIPPTSCPSTMCGIDGFLKIPTCTSLVIRVSYFGIPPIYSIDVGMCLSDNLTPVRCSTDMWNFATGAQGVDPLMVAETAKSLVEAVVAKFLIVLVITMGLASFILTMVLFLPTVFNWRHARNLHFLCIVLWGASSFFLFILILITKSGVAGAIVGVTTTSLQVVTAQKGNLTEAFLWIAWVIWLLTFLMVWWVRWWEILDRREAKRIAKKKMEDDKKKKEEEEKKKAALKDKPMKAEDQVLQQMAAAQM
jgi:Ca2+ regulator and membrane fusion protein Fig1